MSYIDATLLSLQFLDKSFTSRTLRFLVRLYPPCVYPVYTWQHHTRQNLSVLPFCIYILEVISLVPWPHPRFRHLLTWEKITSFPHFSILQATESWAGPGNEARKWSNNGGYSNCLWRFTIHTPSAECSCSCCFWTIFLSLGTRMFAPCCCSQLSWSTGCSLLSQTLGQSYWDYHSCYPKPSRTAVAPVLG